jgi:hypothetical protein
LPNVSVRAWALPLLGLVAGIAGISAVWVAFAELSGSPCSWLALVAAADMAVLLRLTHAPASRTRMLVAALATALAIVLAHWMMVAIRMGGLIGLTPLDSALRLGPSLAWQLAKLALDRVDWVLLFASLPLAAILVQPPKDAESR